MNAFLLAFNINCDGVLLTCKLSTNSAILYYVGRMTECLENKATSESLKTKRLKHVAVKEAVESNSLVTTSLTTRR